VLSVVYGRWKRDRFHETSGARGDVREHDETTTTRMTATATSKRDTTRRARILSSRICYIHICRSPFLSLSFCRQACVRAVLVHPIVASLSLSLSPHIFVSRTALIFGVTALSAEPDLDAASGALSVFHAMASASLTRDRETSKKRPARVYAMLFYSIASSFYSRDDCPSLMQRE